MSTRVILGAAAVPFIWTAICWSSDLVTRGYIWDEDEVWGVLGCFWIGMPILLIGLLKLAFDSRPRRTSS